VSFDSLELGNDLGVKELWPGIMNKLYLNLKLGVPYLIQKKLFLLKNYIIVNVECHSIRFTYLKKLNQFQSIKKYL
jgi:hypothetical protein